MTVKGFFLKNLVEIVKKKKGPEGIEELEKRFGQSVNFSSFKDYPMEMEVELHYAMIDVLYSENKPEAHFEFGRIAFKTYAESLVGKTVFSLFGDDVKKIAMAVSRALNTVTSGLIVETEDLGPNKVKVTMKNNPYPIEYYEGIWTAGIEHFGYKPKVETKTLGKEHYEYVLEWE